MDQTSQKPSQTPQQRFLEIQPRTLSAVALNFSPIHPPTAGLGLTLSLLQEQRAQNLNPSSKRFREQGHSTHPTVLPFCLACWLDRSRLALLRSSHAEEVVKTPSVAAGKSLPRSRCCAAASERVEGANSMLPLVTFLVHCLTVLINSEMTMSTHFRQGSLIFFTCFFTMVSKAMSGVKRPVLNTQGGDKTRQEGEKGQGECHSVTHTSWSRHRHHQNPGHLGWKVLCPLDKP